MSENIPQGNPADASVSLRQKTPNTLIEKLMSHHPLTHFDELRFIDLLEHSLSLSVFEKKRIIDELQYLSQLQIDKLTEVFEDERVEFRKLVSTEWETIKGLVVKAQNEWEQLKDIYITEMEQAEQERRDFEKAEELKKSLWL